jgi:hypothetical protein
MKKLIAFIASFALVASASAQPDKHSPWGVKTPSGYPPVVVFGGNLVGFGVTGFYPVDGFTKGGDGAHIVLIQIDGTNFADINPITKKVTPAKVCPAVLQKSVDAEAFLKTVLTEGKKYEVKMFGWKGLKEGRLDIMGRVPPNVPVIMGDVIVDGKSVKELLIEKGFNSSVEELNKVC